MGTLPALSGFQVDDRISVNISCDDKILDAIKQNRDYLSNEVLAVNIELDELKGDFKVEFFVNKYKVQLGISKKNK